jgi:branched-chain amino acid transport system ATP-binding protein
MSLFQVQGLVKRFGGLLATDHVSLTVEPGEIHALIGPNGAGKTTLVNLISGLLRQTPGASCSTVDLTAPAHASAHPRWACRAASRSRAFFRTKACATTWCWRCRRTAAPAFASCSPAPEHGLYERAEQLAERVGLQHQLRRNWRQHCRMAPSARSTSPWRWQPRPSCCCWTSPWPAWGRMNRCRWWS